MYCLKCGEQNDSNSSFCKKCGGVLEKNNEKPYSEIKYQQNDIKVESQDTFNNQQQNQNTVGYNYDEKKPNKHGLKKISIFLIIIALFIVALYFIITTLFPNSKTYCEKGYCLEYDRNWSIATLAGGQKAFQYKIESSYLAFNGISALSDSNINFNTTSGQQQMYQDFYNLWDENTYGETTLKVYRGSNGFSKLTDSIYYATYDYGVSANNISGKYILLVSPSKNALISFMTNAVENVENNDKRALELLKGIDIYEQTSTKKQNDDNSELYNYSKSMLNWNRYSNLREGTLAKNKTINGGWRILSDSETYWKFENEQFWWYKSINDFNDNYWYGTTQIFKGREGLLLAGFSEANIDRFISIHSLSVVENDVYTIVFKPIKMIMDGVDQSSIKITSETSWKYVWMLFDHGNEGIEAQLLDPISGDIKYYVKKAD